MQKTCRLLKTLCVTALCLGLLALAPAGVEDDAEAPAFRFLISLSRGTLVICGGGDVSDEVFREFIDAAGGERARVVVITTASETADSDEIEDELAFWRAQPLERLTVLHTRSRQTANDPEFASPLVEATGVWFVGGKQAWLADTYVGTTCERMIHGVLRRGGVVGGISAGAAVMSPVMIRHGETSPEIGRGFGLLPGTLIDQHFLARNRQERLLGALKAHPGLVGLGIDERAAIVVRGCLLSVIGDSQVVACITSAFGKRPLLETLQPGQQANLLALSQAANRGRTRHIVYRPAGLYEGGD